MFGWLADRIIDHRKWVLAVVACVATACALTIPKLEFNFTPQQLFESTSDYDKLRNRFAERFGREDNLFTIVVRAEDAYDPEVLTWLHGLTLRLRALESTRTVESLTTLQIPRGGGPGVLTTRPLAMEIMEEAGVDPLDPDEARLGPEQAREIEEFVRDEPLLRGRVVDNQGQLLTVLAWIDDEIQEATDLAAVDEAIAAELAARPPPESIQAIEVGGIPRVRVDVVESLRSEQLLFVPVTGAVYLVILLVLFRRPAGALLPVGTVACAAAMTVALLVATGSAINIINNVLPSLIFIIGIADSVHMLTRQAEEIEQGAEVDEATRAMIRHTGAACLLTSTTTAVGFISLIVADTDILKAFGWQAAAGVMFAYLATLFFLPSALTFLRPVERIRPSDQAEPIRELTEEALERAPRLERMLLALARRVLARPWLMIGAGLLVTSLFVGLSLRVDIDTKILEVYQEDHPTVQLTQLLEREFGGILPVEISIEHPERDHFKDPEVYAKLREFARFARSREGFLSSQTLVDFHQAARGALMDDPAQRDVMPTSRAQIEQIQLLIEGPPDSRRGVRGFVTGDFSNARVLLRVEDFGARKMIREGRALQDKLDELFPPERGYETYIAGDAYVASVALDSFIRDLLYSLLLAMGIIFLMMTAVFRSIKLGLISVIPNVTPLIVTFGYMGWAGIDLNTTTIIIFAISLGLAVDDTIHFLARFREELDRRATVQEALLYTYFGAGRAILLTSVMLVIGLSILLLSDFVPTNQFGRLTAITIFGAVFGDLLLLPPILLLAYRAEEPAHAEEQ